MSGTLERVLRALEDGGFGPRRSGDGWVSRCPAYADLTPSLTMRAGTSNPGSVLVRCFAGCTYRQVIAALGLVPRSEHKPRTELLDAERVEHVYHDAQGAPV